MEEQRAALKSPLYLPYFLRIRLARARDDRALSMRSPPLDGALPFGNVVSYIDFGGCAYLSVFTQELVASHQRAVVVPLNSCYPDLWCQPQLSQAASLLAINGSKPVSA